MNRFTRLATPCYQPWLNRSLFSYLQTLLVTALFGAGAPLAKILLGGENWAQPLIILYSRGKELHQAFHYGAPGPAPPIIPTFKNSIRCDSIVNRPLADEGFVNDLEKRFQ